MQSAPTKYPFCPSCGESMILARIIPGSDELPPLNVFECARCAVYLSEASHERPQVAEAGHNRT